MAEEKAGQERVVERQANPRLTPDMPQPPGVVERRRRVPKKQRKGPFVKYVGAASHRRIHPHQWKILGVDVKQDKDKNVVGHEWSPANDYMVESDQFTDAQLDYLLIDDVSKATGAHQFLEVDYNKDGQLVQVTDE